MKGTNIWHIRQTAGGYNIDVNQPRDIRPDKSLHIDQKIVVAIDVPMGS